VKTWFQSDSKNVGVTLALGRAGGASALVSVEATLALIGMGAVPDLGGSLFEHWWPRPRRPLAAWVPQPPHHAEPRTRLAGAGEEEG